MKLKDDFILRNIAGQTVVLPSGGDLDLNMMITLNETALSSGKECSRRPMRRLWWRLC